MRREDKKISDNNTIESILKSASVCRLGLADKGTPYIVPVNFVYHDNVIFIHSSKEGRKIEMIMKNNYACFEIEDKSEIIPSDLPCSISTKYRSLIGYGRISFIDDPIEKTSALNIFVEKFGGKKDSSYTFPLIQKVSILKLEITEISGKQSGNWDIKT